MSFSLSPAVVVREIDLSTTIPAVATSISGIVGKFNWGPSKERILVTNERELIDIFGPVSENNYEHWYSAWNILQYLQTMYVVRGIDEDLAKNAGIAIEVEGNLTNEVTATKINSSSEYTPSFGSDDTLQFFAKYPSETMNIKIAVSNFKNFYDQLVISADTGQFSPDDVVYIKRSTLLIATAIIKYIDTTYDASFISSQGTVDIYTGAIVKIDSLTTGTGTVGNYYRYTGSGANVDLSTEDYTSGDYVDLGASIQTLYLENVDYEDTYDEINENDVVANEGATISGSTLFNKPKDSIKVDTGINFTDQFEYFPTEDQVAVVVFLGNDIVERYVLSLTEGAKDFEGNNIYLETLLENSSSYIFGYVNDSATKLPANISKVVLTGGVVGDYGTSEAILGYDLFANSEEFDINLIVDGANNDYTTQIAIKDICEQRKDCFGILCPPKSKVVGVSNASKVVSNLVSYRKQWLGSSSYVAFYGNWKYQYDKFSDKYRWIPISGDVNGVFGVTDYTTYPWYAPAGFTRGKIRNAVKLAFNPNKAQRDILYKDMERSD